MKVLSKSVSRVGDSRDISCMRWGSPSRRAAAVSQSPRHNWLRTAALGVVLLSCGLLALHPAAAADVPTATIELTGGSAAAGVGYTWGSGILIFHGKRYPLRVNGISVLHVGVSDYTASGTVYNLHKVSDIDGVYTAVSAGAAVGGGASVTAMKNSNGVLIETVANHEGVNLSLGPKGMSIALAKQNL
jgi:hypothetical protein